jgi:Protein of unknown function (DUF2637)
MRWWNGEAGMTGGAGIRLARNVSAATVALISAWSSYSHTVHVALACGERPEVAYALPFSVDGMLIVATIVMVDDRRRHASVRPIARLAFAAGVAASVAANVAAAHPSLGARAVNAWPALALLLVVEMLARPGAPEARAELPPVPEATHRPTAGALQVPEPEQLPAEPHVLLPVSRLGVVPEHRPGAARLTPADDRDREQPARTAVTTLPGLASRVVPAAKESTGGSAFRSSTDAWPRPAGPAQAGGGREVPELTDSRLARARSPLAVVPELHPAPPGSGTYAGAARPGGDTEAREAPCIAAAGGCRRPAAATRRLALQIIASEPALSRIEVAARLGVSTRRLRTVLAAHT